MNDHSVDLDAKYTRGDHYLAVTIVCVLIVLGVFSA